ncbi:phosphotransferase [Coleofasciculus sp. FACHB-712]|uniref:phosphotransferase enzyme family protein n=1 Tax=Coleofasciculus sp. FACHB-712 TaxID=2692789 RepID=UPI00168638E3|nr:phosphotransferase [Coleofasciculus sp. FACHB-712]MBD1943184.1 phosphotransferase [Coleofasciculus sp. FACHB-712]
MMNDKTFLHLAIEALRNYGLENAQLTRLGGASNTNFKVDADDKSYVLRLHTSAYHDRVAISSELAWLSSLQSETTLVLPKPIVNLNGELVTGVPADSKPETLCTLMSWVEGKISPTVDILTDDQLAKVGSLMAQLHIHSQQFELSEGFKRQTFDEAHFSGRLEVLYTALSNTELDKSDLNSLKVNASHIITHFAQLERKQDSFGVIHADFHSGNYLLCDEKVCIIDFDRCGFGFYLYDLALALMELEEQQRKAFLQGYETVKPLPADYTNLKQVFLCLAYLDNLGFLVANPEELAFVVGELPFAVEAFRNAVETVP